MNRDIEPINYLPPVMQEVREIQELYKGLSPEIILYYDSINLALNECFVLEALSEGLERWEKMLKIKPYINDTVEDRRLRILTRINGDTPYTFERVYNKLRLLCGEKNVNMDYAKEIYTLRVVLELPAKNQFETVLKMLRQMLPCNISLKCLLAYNTHKKLMGYTHGELRAYTHKDLRESVLKNRGGA